MSLLFALLLACAPADPAAPGPAPAEAPAPEGDPGGEGGEAPPAPPEQRLVPEPLPEGALAAQLRPLIAKARPLVERCEAEAAAPIRAAGGEQVPEGLAPEAIEAACLGVRDLRVEVFRLYPHSRDAMMLGNSLARVDDDARVLAMLLEKGREGPPLASAAEHLQRSVPEELARLATLEARTSFHDEARTVALTEPAVVREGLRRDAADMDPLVEMHQRYAVQQGGNPAMVRRALLGHFARRALFSTRVRMAQVQALHAARPEAEVPDIDAALAALRAYVDAFVAAVAEANKGWPGGQGASALHDDLVTKQAAWAAAREALAP